MIALDAGPFFSNDLPGALKVLAAFGLTAGGIAAFVWKVMHSELTKRIDGAYAEHTRMREDFKRDVDGLGKNVNSVIASCTENTTNLAGLQMWQIRSESEHKQLFEGHGRVVGQVDQLAANVARHASENTASITAHRETMQKELGQIRESVADLRGAVRELRPRDGGD